MKTFTWIVLIGLAVAVSNAPCLACSMSGSPPSVEQAFRDFNVVLVGRVENVSWDPLVVWRLGQQLFGVEPEVDGDHRVRVTVKEVLKGDFSSGERIVFVTGLNPSACGIPFIEGPTYILLAFQRRGHLIVVWAIPDKWNGSPSELYPDYLHQLRAARASRERSRLQAP